MVHLADSAISPERMVLEREHIFLLEVVEVLLDQGGILVPGDTSAAQVL